MIEWTAESNGHLLVIKMDKDALHKSIQSDIEYWRDHQKALDAEVDPENREAMELDLRYERCRIGTYHDECDPGGYMPIDDCIANLKEMDKAVDDLAEKDPIEVIAMYTKKKNGTFSKSVRPQIFCLSFGTLYEDAYGWSTTQLRMRAISDTEAVVELDNTIVKW